MNNMVIKKLKKIIKTYMSLLLDGYRPSKNHKE